MIFPANDEGGVANLQTILQSEDNIQRNVPISLPTCQDSH